MKSSDLSGALLFPGQGSQFEGMAKGVQSSAAALDLFVEAGKILGYDLLDLVESADQERLGDTAVAQPAIFVTSLALLACVGERASRREGEKDSEDNSGNSAFERVGRFSSVAGHSLGEYTALVAAGMLSFREGLELVATRAEAMKRACEMTKGAMVALLGAEAGRVEEACAERRSKGGAIWVANFNAPGQVVVSGELSEVQRAIDHPSEFGSRRAVLLDVAGACHSPLMAPASKMLEGALKEAEFKKSSALVWSNVTARPYPSPEEARTLLARQLVEPVRWMETLENIRRSGESHFVCFGPADTMAGIAKRCLAAGRRSDNGNDLRISRIETFDAAVSPPVPEVV